MSTERAPRTPRAHPWWRHPWSVLALVAFTVAGILLLDLLFGAPVSPQIPLRPKLVKRMMRDGKGKLVQVYESQAEDEDGVPVEVPDLEPGFVNQASKADQQAELERVRKDEEGFRIPGPAVVEDKRVEVFECNYTHVRTDVCKLRGLVQLNVTGYTFTLLATQPDTPRGNFTNQPYPRKQYPGAKDNVTPIELLSVDAPEDWEERKDTDCAFVHDVPAVVFSIAGHTGNYYHDMNDGWIPIWITTYRYNRDVVLVISDWMTWWLEKYESLLFAVSRHPVIRIGPEQKYGRPAPVAGLHCFREVIVGVEIHQDMAVNPALMPGGVQMSSIGERWAQVLKLPKLYPQRISGVDKTLRLGFVHRAEATRSILNENEVMEVARQLGFEVVMLDQFESMVEMFKIVRTLDVLVGIHGSGLSNFMFMRGNTVLIQVTPFCLEWFSDNSFGYGSQYHLHYINPLMTWEESSLFEKHANDSELHTDCMSIDKKYGWKTWAGYFLEANATWEPDHARLAFEDAKGWLVTRGNRIRCVKPECPKPGVELREINSRGSSDAKPARRRLLRNWEEWTL